MREKNPTCPQLINSHELWPPHFRMPSTPVRASCRIYDSPIFRNLSIRSDAMTTRALRRSTQSVQSDSQEARGGVKCLLQWQINAAWLPTLHNTGRLVRGYTELLAEREHCTLWSWVTVRRIYFIIKSQKWVCRVQPRGSQPSDRSACGCLSPSAQTSECVCLYKRMSVWTARCILKWWEMGVWVSRFHSEVRRTCRTLTLTPRCVGFHEAVVQTDDFRWRTLKAMSVPSLDTVQFSVACLFFNQTYG